ncbi:unnamed protein product [Phytophthora fragariaefolia]|uniref:Unnamed protein product n=1 Tax=Phytophthora fragariaefolia TaxID=1490495 RepID=A0A9W6WRR5_9STRA|nr:unnamed protein product [Phytophthora fragariaefolia]
MQDVVDLVSSSSDDASDDASGEQEQQATPVRLTASACNPMIAITVSSKDDTSQEGKSVGPTKTTDPKRVRLEAADPADAAIFNYQQQGDQQKKMKRKNNPYPIAKSRTPSHQARRAPVKDSKRIYYAKTMKSQSIHTYLVVPGVCDALHRLCDKRVDEAKCPAFIVQDDESEREVEAVLSVESKLERRRILLMVVRMNDSQRK